MYALQMQWRNEISNLGTFFFVICYTKVHSKVYLFNMFDIFLLKICVGSGLKCLVDAAENYHKVLAENQKLFNEVQELKGIFVLKCFLYLRI
jgi:kinesin family protein C2/C3